MENTNKIQFNAELYFKNPEGYTLETRGGKKASNLDDVTNGLYSYQTDDCKYRTVFESGNFYSEKITPTGPRKYYVHNKKTQLTVFVGTNQESEVYKKLSALRVKEIQIENDNELAINKKTGLTFKTYLGHQGQQNFRRVTEYRGFNFIEKDKVDMKIWKLHSENKDTYIPNKRTKLGREMDEFLMNGLSYSNFNKPFEIIKIKKPSGKFSFIFVEEIKGIIVIYNGKNPEPKSEHLIEITKKEFNELCSA